MCLRARLKTRMSPSNSVTVSELSLGIELQYDIVSFQQYALAQKSLPIHKHCVRRTIMLKTLCSTQRFQHTLGRKSALRTIRHVSKLKLI